MSGLIDVLLTRTRRVISRPAAPSARATLLAVQSLSASVRSAFSTHVQDRLRSWAPRVWDLWETLSQRWGELSLARQFTLASTHYPK